MNNQSTIDCFFKTINNIGIGIDGNEIKMRKYFYIKWTNQFRPDFDGCWLIDRPEKINFIQHVNCDYIKKGYYFYICGYFENYESDEYNIVKEMKYKNVHLLKSHLQKNIRKMDVNRALSTSLHLMKLDFNEFLRRMIIIHIEDTFIHESLTTLIWLMIALSTKKFKMKKYIYQWLLGFVYISANTKKLDNYNKKLKNMVNNSYKNIYEELNDYENLNNNGNNNGNRKLNENQISMLISLHMRIAYGCMDVDKVMIKKCIQIWKTRFINNNGVLMNNMLIKPINIYVCDLKLENWDYSAVDFHTNKNICEFILKKYNYLDVSKIKKLIWNNSSGVNYRKENVVFESETWDTIKEYVYKTQKYLLETNS